jgi:hypothetical protein
MGIALLSLSQNNTPTDRLVVADPKNINSDALYARCSIATLEGDLKQSI